MKHLCIIILAAFLCVKTSAQTVRTLAYNISNNTVIGATNTNALTFSNSFAWATNTLAGATRTNLALGWSALTNSNSATSLLGFTANGQVVANTGTNVLTFTNNVNFASGDLQVSGTQIIGNGVYIDYDDGSVGGGPITLDTNASIAFQGASAATTRANLGFSTNLSTLWTATNASNARSAVGLGATWLTNTNVTNFRTAVGLGENSEPSFLRILVTDGTGTNGAVEFAGDGISFPNDSFKAFYRGDLGLPLAALTNTSNATMMRALSGSTNTNHPFSGSISVTGTNNTNTLVFSNGILQSVQ